MGKTLLLFLLLFTSCVAKERNESNTVPTKDTSLNTSKFARTKNGKKIVDSSFLFFWKDFSKIIKAKNLAQFKTNSLDSIRYYQKNILIDDFLKSYNTAFSDTILTYLADTSKVYFTSSGVETYSGSAGHSEYTVIPACEVYIEMGPNEDGGMTLIRLKFIKVKDGYKFYNYDKFG